MQLSYSEATLIILVQFILLCILFIFGLRKIKVNRRKYISEIQEKEILLEHYKKKLTIKFEAKEAELINEINFKKRLINILVHDIQSPIIFIGNFSNYLAKQTECQGEGRNDIINEINLNINYLKDFTSDIFRWIKQSNYNSNFTIEKYNVDFLDHLTDTLKLYQKIALSKNVNITIKAEKNLEVNADWTILDIIIRNLIDNAIKNTLNGIITINCRQLTDSYEIKISNPGNSKDFNTLIQNNSLKAYKGSLGLFIINDLLKIINGKLIISFESNEIISITIQIPK